MSEKYIVKKLNKKGYTLRVVIRVDGVSKQFGTFNRADYASDKLCLEDAKICRDEALIRIRQNRVIRHELTVREAFDLCLTTLVSNIKTRERYETRFRTSVPVKYHNRKLSTIRASEIQKMLNKYADTHSTEQVKRIRSMWSQIYKASLLDGCPLADQSLIVKIPKGRKPAEHREKFCTMAEYEQFMDALLTYGKDRNKVRTVYLGFRVMQYLGLRPSEAFGLCRQDIDLINGRIFVRRMVGSTNDSKRTLVSLKTEESNRVLPIPADLRPYLVEMLARNTEPLLSAPDGLPFEIDDLDTLLGNVRKSKKCPRVTLYMLRHLFADDLTKKDLKLTQSMLGHVSPEMSLRYANKTSLEDMEKALEKRYS